MAYQPNYEKIASTQKIELGEKQSTVECALSAGEANITSILSCGAKAVITNVVYDKDRVKYNGFVNFQVIYLGDDGATYGLDYSAEYKDELLTGENKNIVPYGTCSVVDVEPVVNGNDIRVVATVEYHFSALENTETNALTSLNNDDVFVKTNDITVCSYNGSVETRYDASYDLEIKDTVGKVLSVCPTCYLTNITYHNGYAQLNGQMYINACYFGGDKGGVQNYTTTCELSFEVANDKISENGYLLGSCYVDLPNMKVSTTVEDDRAFVSLALPVVYQGHIVTCQAFEVVNDLYHLEQNILTTTSSFDTMHVCDQFSVSETIDGSVTVDSSMPFVDDVIGVCASRTTVTSAKVVEGDIVLEGVANATVLYYSKEDNSTNSISVDIPFSIPLKTNTDCDKAMVKATLVDLSAKSKRGQEIAVFGKLAICVTTYYEDTVAVISNVEEGEKRAEAKYSLSIYFVKDGETIWDIAKALSIPQEVLLEQNPDIELPLVAGNKLFVYRQK